MSASLVGSEMCIRDRPTCTLRPSLLPCGQPGPGHRIAGRQTAAPEWRIDCLLYTSDAADDM
eukprot:7126248-Alexandrium_andersonii.AAC.1